MAITLQVVIVNGTEMVLPVRDNREVWFEGRWFTVALHPVKELITLLIEPDGHDSEKRIREIVREEIIRVTEDNKWIRLFEPDPDRG